MCCYLQFYMYIGNVNAVRSQFGKAKTTSHQSANCDINEAITFQCSSAKCIAYQCKALEDKATNVSDPFNDRRLINKSCKGCINLVPFLTVPLHRDKVLCCDNIASYCI